MEKMYININDIYKDKLVQEGEVRGSTESLNIVIGRGRIIGYILTPNHKEGERRPALLMLHGFPGICNNHDLAQLFRNAGFVVFVPNAPGAWGSKGCYSFDGIVEAACEVAETIHNKEYCEAYGVDPENIFLFGHSMGGFTAINIAKRIPWFKACVFAAPCDLDWMCRHPENGFIDKLTERASEFLVTDTDLSENARRIHKSFSFESAYSGLLGKNFMVIRCEYDEAIPADSLEEFNQRICSNEFGKGAHRFITLPTDHGFNDYKFGTAKTVLEFFFNVMHENDSTQRRGTVNG